jgi:hypothetical protein
MEVLNLPLDPPSRDRVCPKQKFFEQPTPFAGGTRPNDLRI